MSHTRTIQLIAVAGLVVCLAGSGLLSAQVRHQRDRLNLGPRRDLDEKLPPYLVVTNRMSGPFRGLVIDMMWYRLENMKQEGKFHEANQLSRGIVTLQPRFPKVWAFMAWNMAYNISVKTDTPQERWDWVSKGINLLRDEGIPLNPDSVGLYKELSWIFSHKVGQYSDDMHWHYRAELAEEWQEVLGAPTVGAEPDEALAFYRRIADAPDTLEQVVAANPGVATFLAQAAATANAYQPDVTLLRAIGRVRMFTRALGSNITGVKWMEDRGLYDTGLAKLVNDPKHADALDALLPHLRKRALVDTYHMDPAYMLTLMEKYNPLDFRHPCSHAVYWAALGVKRGAEIWEQNKDIDLLNTDRQVIHSLQALMDSGRILYDPFEHTVQMLPDVDFIESYETAVDTATARLLVQEGLTSGVKDTFEAGHENFLLRAMSYEYLYGDEEKARRYYLDAAKRYGKKPHNVREGTFQKPIKQLVMEWMADDLSLSAGTQYIEATLSRAFLVGLGNNDGDLYNRHMEMAQAAYDRLMQNTMADARTEQRRMGLPPFPVVVARVLEGLLRSPQISVVRRSRTWHNTPIGLRRMVYDSAIPNLTAHAEAVGLDPQRAFPEPPGMQEYREQRTKALEQQQQQRGNAQGPIIERK